MRIFCIGDKLRKMERDASDGERARMTQAESVKSEAERRIRDVKEGAEREKVQEASRKCA